MRPEMEEEDDRFTNNGASNYYEYGEGASIGVDGSGNVTTSGQRVINSKGNSNDGQAYVVIAPDGTRTITSGRVANKLMARGAKYGGDENVDSNGDCCGSMTNGNWSSQDKKWFSKNPKYEKIIKSLAFRAVSTASFVSISYKGGEDGYGDAYRHAYFMFLITKRLGPDIAKSFGDNHENVMFKDGIHKWVNNKDYPRGKMDLNNNNWGIKYALQKNSKISNFNSAFNDAVIDNKIIIINKRTIPRSATKKGRAALAKNASDMTRYSRFGEN